MTSEPGPIRHTAHAVVNARAVGAALDLLTAIATPLHVRVEIEAESLVLATHGDGPWWSTVTVPTTGASGTHVSACVARMDFRQAVDAEAMLVPDARCSITVVQDDVVRYGGFALAAASSPDPQRPLFDGAGDVVELWKLAGARYAAPDGRVFELPAASLQRFTDRAIEHAALVDSTPTPYLVGQTTGDHDMVLTLIAQGRWSEPGAETPTS